jgi:hypothetical protein
MAAAPVALTAVTNLSYGLQGTTLAAYLPHFLSFRSIYEPELVDLDAGINQTRIGALALTDSNLAAFLFGQWGDGIPRGSLKKIMAAMQAMMQGAALGEIKWNDSAKLPLLYAVVKAIKNDPKYKTQITTKAFVETATEVKEMMLVKTTNLREVYQKMLYVFTHFGACRAGDLRMIRQCDVSYGNDFTSNSAFRAWDVDIFLTKTTPVAGAKPSKVVSLVCICADSNLNAVPKQLISDFKSQVARHGQLVPCISNLCPFSVLLDYVNALTKQFGPGVRDSNHAFFIKINTFGAQMRFDPSYAVVGERTLPQHLQQWLDANFRSDEQVLSRGVEEDEEEDPFSFVGKISFGPSASSKSPSASSSKSPSASSSMAASVSSSKSPSASSSMAASPAAYSSLAGTARRPAPTPHAGRNTALTLAMSSGAAPQHVAQSSGHRDMKSLAGYLPVSTASKSALSRGESLSVAAAQTQSAARDALLRGEDCDAAPPQPLPKKAKHSSSSGSGVVINFHTHNYYGGADGDGEEEQEEGEE